MTDVKDRSGCWAIGYLRFLVEELKPFIDSSYRTLPTGRTPW